MSRGFSEKNPKGCVEIPLPIFSDFNSSLPQPIYRETGRVNAEIYFAWIGSWV